MLGLLAITPVKLHRQAIAALSVVVALYGVTSEIATAVGCGAPQPWNVKIRRCLSRVCEYIPSLSKLYETLANSLKAIAFILCRDYGHHHRFLPDRSPELHRSSTSNGFEQASQDNVVFCRKNNVWKTFINVFFPKILDSRATAIHRVIAATATQLSYLDRTFHTDFTLESFAYIICTQVVQALSIVTSCVLYLNRFFDSLNTGLVWTARMRHQRLFSDGKSSKGTTSDLQGSANLELRGVPPSSSSQVETSRNKYGTGWVRV